MDLQKHQYQPLPAANSLILSHFPPSTSSFLPYRNIATKRLLLQLILRSFPRLSLDFRSSLGLLRYTLLLFHIGVHSTSARGLSLRVPDFDSSTSLRVHAISSGAGLDVLAFLDETFVGDFVSVSAKDNQLFVQENG